MWIPVHAERVEKLLAISAAVSSQFSEFSKQPNLSKIHDFSFLVPRFLRLVDGDSVTLQSTFVPPIFVTPAPTLGPGVLNIEMWLTGKFLHFINFFPSFFVVSSILSFLKLVFILFLIILIFPSISGSQDVLAVT